jgi:hypothetical protein
VTAIGSTHVYLFIAAPARLAMMLGHRNLMPPTTIYEQIRPGYAPTLTVS